MKTQYQLQKEREIENRAKLEAYAGVIVAEHPEIPDKEKVSMIENYRVALGVADNIKLRKAVV